MENMNNLQKCSLCGQVYHENIIFKANNIFISAENLQEKPSMHLHNYARGGGSIKLSQCDKCGYIENLAFNKNEMQKMYSSAGYYQTKILPLV